MAFYYDKETGIKIQCSKFSEYQDYLDAIEDVKGLSDDGRNLWRKKLNHECGRYSITRDMLMDNLPSNARSMMEWLKTGSKASWFWDIYGCEDCFAFTLITMCPSLWPSDGFLFESMIPYDNWHDPDVWTPFIEEIHYEIFPEIIKRLFDEGRMDDAYRFGLLAREFPW